MLEEGIINQLRHRWVRRRDPSTCAHADADAANRVEANLDHVVTLFMAWAAGVALAVAVWCLEHLRKQLEPPKEQQQPQQTTDPTGSKYTVDEEEGDAGAPCRPLTTASRLSTARGSRREEVVEEFQDDRRTKVFGEALL